MPDVLLRGGRIYAAGVRDATAMLLVDGRVAWVGTDDGAQAAQFDVAAEDLGGALVTPAFVDAHVHLTETGIALDTLDLRGATSLVDVLDRVAARARSSTGPVLASGWDESGWPHGAAPTSADLDAAAPGRAVLLTRADLHSAVASPTFLELVPQIASADGWDRETGRLQRDAGAAARGAVRALLGPQGRRAAALAALRRAAAQGIASVHEMGGPTLGGEDDLSQVLALAASEPDVPHVAAYWAEPFEAGVSAAARLGARAGGDLCIDGSIGSGSALLRDPYNDRDGCGSRYLDAAQVRDHVLACTRADMQTSFHAIGDAALDEVLAGFVQAAQVVGEPAVRALRHRLEHLVMADAGHIEILARLGILASVQPAFDAFWGGSSGAYASRLGQERARATHPLRSLSAAGVPLALGSDSPVTALDPWGGVRAAVQLHERSQSLTARAAFIAHTRGGWRAAGLDDSGAGVLAPGAPATYAIWEAGRLRVTAPDRTVAAWSTDPRSCTPGLPDLDDAPPRCLRTVLEGRTIYSG